MSNPRAWRWATYAEWFVELVIGLAISYPAVLNAYYVSPTVNAIIRGLLTLLNLVLWIVLAFVVSDQPVGVGQRGSALTRQYSVYFLLAFAANAILLSGWLVQVIKYGSLQPQDFFNNTPAFFVRRAIDTLSVVTAGIVTFFVFYDARHSVLRQRVAAVAQKR